MRKASEVRDVFPRNLALLMRGEASISAFCREIGVNRTQFNRYLSGASSPRPEVLSRICGHFGVDARILLEPLDEMETEAERAPVADAFAALLGPRRFDISTELLPNGFYRRWRQSFSQPGRIAHMLAYIKQDGESRVFRTATRVAVPDGPDPSLSRRGIQGVVLGSADSFMIFTKFAGGPTICNAVFEYTHRSTVGVYPGIALFARARHPQAKRLAREALEFVPTERGAIREAARHPRFCCVTEAPSSVQEILCDPITDQE